MEHRAKYALYISVALAIISLLLSAIAICRTSNRFLDFDGLTIIIGALAIIVAVLIGWQLTVLIDLKNYNEKFTTLTENVQTEINRAKGYSALGYAHNNIAWLTPSAKSEWFIEYVRNSLAALTYFSRAKDYNTCWAIVDELVSNIEGGGPELYSAVKSRKEEWLYAIGEIESPSKIENYKELMRIIKLF